MSKYSYNKGFDFGDFEITKREIIVSISIIAVLLIIGILISNNISEFQMDKNEKYNKAVKIESVDLFQYGMNTNVGNAFVYGELEAVDKVTYPEIDGEYMYVNKVKEKYTMHTETYTTTDGKGHTQTHTRTYWTWDRVGSEDKKCKEISFCGITFKSNKFNINILNTDYIKTIKESSHIRYKYYGIKSKLSGTIFTKLKDGTISNNTKFYDDMNINETVKYLESGGGEIIFWILWIIFMIACVFGFYYLDNNWLD